MSKFEQIAREIYEWCKENDLWDDNIIYFDGKAWANIVEYINDEDLPAVRSKIIDAIFTGKTIGCENNYSVSELEVRRA